MFTISKTQRKKKTEHLKAESPKPERYHWHMALTFRPHIANPGT